MCHRACAMHFFLVTLLPSLTGFLARSGTHTPRGECGAMRARKRKRGRDIYMVILVICDTHSVIDGVVTLDSIRYKCVRKQCISVFGDD